MEQSSQHELDLIHSDVEKLIAKQRLLRLVEGSRFLKYTAKGQRVKDKFWLCKLSPNHQALFYSDLDDNEDPQINQLPNRINISDIRRVVTGKDCPHTRDGHMKKSTADLAFSILHESDHEDHLNFVAPDRKSFCYWTDGLNSLLRHEMISEEYQKELQMLSKIEIKMRSMNK